MIVRYKKESQNVQVVQIGAFRNVQGLGWFRASENLLLVHASPSQSTSMISSVHTFLGYSSNVIRKSKISESSKNMNGCRLTKMAVEIVSLTHVVTTPDYDVFPQIQSRAG